jgi:prepilin peptidase CpaA
MNNPYLMVPFLLLLVGLALYDWKYRLIKNKVIFPAMGVAFLFRLFFHDLSMMDSFLGFLFGGTVLFIGEWLGMVGAGDVKLMALVGFIFGLIHTFYIYIGLCLLLALTWLFKGNQKVPFAPYILVAVCITYFIS